MYVCVYFFLVFFGFFLTCVSSRYFWSLLYSAVSPLQPLSLACFSGVVSAFKLSEPGFGLLFAFFWFVCGFNRRLLFFLYLVLCWLSLLLSALPFRRCSNRRLLPPSAYLSRLKWFRLVSAYSSRYYTIFLPVFTVKHITWLLGTSVLFVGSYCLHCCRRCRGYRFPVSIFFLVPGNMFFSCNFSPAGHCRRICRFVRSTGSTPSALRFSSCSAGYILYLFCCVTAPRSVLSALLYFA